jgi:hypothetical protein
MHSSDPRLGYHPSSTVSTDPIAAMPLDLSDTLVVGISATALFDLAEADAVYKAKYAKNPNNALDEYRAYMLERENEPLRDGTGMALLRDMTTTSTSGFASEGA